MEAHCVNLELKYQNQALKERQHGQFSKVKSNEAKVKHDIDVIERINIELEHKVAKLLKENETLKKHYKELSDSIKKKRVKTIEHTTSLIAKNTEFKAQLQEKGFAIVRDSAVIKPPCVSASSESSNSSKNMPRFSSNDMVHNHYLEEAKKKTQEKGRNLEPSVIPSARLQRTANGSKPKSRINNQKSRNWPASKSSCITTKIVPIAEHSRNSRKFSDSKHFVCSTCQKCVFNVNHDACVTKFLNDVNSRAKTSIVHEKTMTPRYCLRWKPTGKIFNIVGPRWVPTGKIFASSTTKVDSEPTNGSNDDITNQYEWEQNLDLSAGSPFNLKKERIKTWIKDNVISRRPRLHGIASLQEISARPSSQGIRSLLTS
ncbi:hypothetical protein Tco_1125637 [Tanacetum coccineum]|uniref:Uncharacterized protein n=1 Tax=Tanacetum coccineum TaxID=301880 RepID=A0ABQ5J9I9_9ASTR